MNASDGTWHQCPPDAFGFQILRQKSATVVISLSFSKKKIDIYRSNVLIYLSRYGEMSERFMELVLKTSDPATGQGFESLSLRHFFLKSEYCPLFSTWRSTQAGRRGAPAKGVGRVTGARVRISPSPPKGQQIFLQYLLSFFSKFELYFLAIIKYT